MRLLHLSDLHFGKPFRADVAECLLATARRLGPDLVVISGNLTQRARPGEFAQFGAFRQRLGPARTLVVPGNHDVPLYRVWERLLYPYREYTRHVGAERDVVLNTPRAMLVGLDSTNPRGAITNGRISRTQIGLCREAFAAARPGQWRVVVLHHHLVPPPTFDRHPPMPRARRLIDALTALGVDLVLGGHLHRAFVGNTLDVYPGRHREQGIVVVQCGTSTSRRGRGLEQEKNSFNWLQLDEAVLHVQHHVYFSGDQAFRLVARHQFPRPGSGYLRTVEGGAGAAASGR